MHLDPPANFGFLVSDISRLLREQFNNAAASLGLTLAQARVLVQLARNEGINQTALAAILEVQPITLLRQIDKLEKAGLVERRPDPNDRRAQQLYLTAIAQPHLERIFAVGSNLSETAFAGFDERAQRLVIDLLQQVRKNLSPVTTDAIDSEPGERSVEGG
jgi:MarR family transcriptional regulator for hemolysin